MFKKIALAGGVSAMLLGSTAYASVIDRPFFQVLGVVVVWGGTDFDSNSGTAPVVSDFVLLTPASGTAGADLIGGDDVYSVVTGTLDPIPGDNTGNGDNPSTFDPITGTGSGNFTDGGSANGVLDAGDTMTAFGLDNTTDTANLVGQHKSSFFVASNAPFNIAANSSNLQTSDDFSSMGLANIGLTMTADVDGDNGAGNLSYGSAAQLPTASGGFATDVDDLSDLTADKIVFSVDQKTADTVGSIAEQSIRINSVYTLDTDTGTAGVQGYDLSMGVGTISADVTYTVFVP